MMATNKTKVLFVFTTILVLVGMFLPYELWIKKTSEHEKPFIGNPKMNNMAYQNEPNHGAAAFIKEESSTHNQRQIAVENNRIDNTFDLSGDDLPLPSLSMLPIEDENRAKAFFENCRTNWLSIEDCSADYQASIRTMTNGKLQERNTLLSSGHLDIKVNQAKNPKESILPIYVQVHLYNKESGLHFLNDSKKGLKNSKPVIWADDSSSRVDLDDVKYRTLWGAFPIQSLYMIMELMSKTYKDENLKDGITREQFFKERGIPYRRSNKDETSKSFSDEEQYLFHPYAGSYTENLWISVDSGEIRQLDTGGGNSDISFSYRFGDYIENKSKSIKFPTHYTITMKKGKGEQQKGYEYTLLLSNVNINNKNSFDGYKKFNN